MKVDAKVWEARRGVVTILKFDGKLYRNNGNVREGSGRIPIVEEWIMKEEIDEFSTEEFFKVHPQQKLHRGQYDKIISELVAKNRLQQLGNEKFKVLKF